MNLTQEYTSVRLANDPKQLFALFRATIEDPGDEAICLVYADALEEAGKIEQAKEWRMQFANRQLMHLMRDYLVDVFMPGWPVKLVIVPPSYQALVSTIEKPSFGEGFVVTGIKGEKYLLGNGIYNAFLLKDGNTIRFPRGFRVPDWNFSLLPTTPLTLPEFKVILNGRLS